MTTYAERGEPGAGDGFEDPDYRRVGLEPDEAKGWRRWAIEPIDAIRWIKAQVDDPVAATQWSTAGVRPEVVSRLVKAGLTSSLAAQWHEFGADAETALTEHTAGRQPSDYQNRANNAQRRVNFRAQASSRGLRATAAVAAVVEAEDQTDDVASWLKTLGSVSMSYLQLSWTDEQAKEWATVGIDAFDARDWLEMGLEPKEAARCERANMSATSTALAWWRAGIPVDEVAAWLGAGLTPVEAVNQRAKGVTAEQAAVLRSLRRSEDD